MAILASGHVVAGSPPWTRTTAQGALQLNADGEIQGALQLNADGEIEA